jgi:hypothetical protein
MKGNDDGDDWVNSTIGTGWRRRLLVDDVAVLNTIARDAQTSRRVAPPSIYHHIDD